MEPQLAIVQGSTLLPVITLFPPAMQCPPLPPSTYARLDAVLHVPKALVQLAGAGAVVVHAQPLLH